MKKITNDCHAHSIELLRVWRNYRNVNDKTERLSPQETTVLTRSVQELSAGLTGDRDLIGSKYLSDPDLLGAYLLYFWQMSYLQARHVLSLLPFQPKNTLDLGCGPGPVSLALADIGASVTAADYSKNALSLARMIAEKSHASIRFLHWDAVKQPLPDGVYDCIIASHMLNELWNGADKIELRADFLERAASRLTDNGVIVLIEPALFQVSRDALAVRDEMKRRGFSLMYPCPGEFSCPALTVDSGMCHTAFDYERPPMLDAIVQKAGFKKEALKMTTIILSKKTVKHRPGAYRVVSDRMETKNGRLRYLICGNGERLSLSVDKKLVGEPVKAFHSIRRGVLLSFVSVEKRENGFGITADSVITFH